MIKKRYKGVSAPTIDQIDPTKTPSLVGFWKFTDFIASTGTVPDHSGNGFDMQAMQVDENYNLFANPYVEQSPNHFHLNEDGYLICREGWALLTDVITDTVMDIGTGYGVFSGSWHAHEAFCDYDGGYGWCGLHQPLDWPGKHGNPGPDPFNGLNVGAVSFASNARIIIDGGSVVEVINKSSDGAFQVMDPNDVAHWAMSYNPTGEFKAINYNVLNPNPRLDSGGPDDAIPGSTQLSPITTVTNNVPASHPIGTGTYARFGHRTGNDGGNATSGGYGAKDWQVWNFSAEPPYFEETLTWMAKNPGRIPPWWIGR